jgi:hypothetical protein
MKEAIRRAGQLVDREDADTWSQRTQRLRSGVVEEIPLVETDPEANLYRITDGSLAGLGCHLERLAGDLGFE